MSNIQKAREITEAKIRFVSLVGRPANKREFLIVKQKGGINEMNKNLKKALTEKISSATIEVFEEAGLIQSDKTVEKNGQHYLHDIFGFSESAASANRTVNKSGQHYLHGLL